MRGDEAKDVCPEIHLVQVHVARGKADLTIYWDAGSEVHKIFQVDNFFKWFQILHLFSVITSITAGCSYSCKKGAM